MKKFKFYFVLLSVLALSCSTSSTDDSNSSNSGSNNNTGNGSGNSSGNGSGNGNSAAWLVPVTEVVDGGPGQDGIPSIDNPEFVNANHASANYIDDSDLVVGIISGNEIKAYPHIILDWHEIVNDVVDGNPVALNYCPLTGTAFGWSRIINGTENTFGTSGLLYNANLILYDRNTQSRWSQLLLKSINGTLISTEPDLVDVVETTWGQWKALFPSTKVLTRNTGFTRSYGVYPYGSYMTDNDFFIFTASPSNSALPNKQRVYAIINDDLARVYQFSDFQNGNTIKEFFYEKQHLIVGNANIINAFELALEHSNLEFEYAFTGSESFFSDNEGNLWNIFGKAIQGPRIGEQLTKTKAVVSYWFAIAAF